MNAKFMYHTGMFFLLMGNLLTLHSVTLDFSNVSMIACKIEFQYFNFQHCVCALGQASCTYKLLLSSSGLFTISNQS